MHEAILLTRVASKNRSYREDKNATRVRKKERIYRKRMFAKFKILENQSHSKVRGNAALTLKGFPLFPHWRGS